MLPPLRWRLLGLAKSPENAWPRCTMVKMGPAEKPRRTLHPHAEMADGCSDELGWHCHVGRTRRKPWPRSRPAAPLGDLRLCLRTIGPMATLGTQSALARPCARWAPRG